MISVITTKTFIVEFPFSKLDAATQRLYQKKYQSRFLFLEFGKFFQSRHREQLWLNSSEHNKVVVADMRYFVKSKFLINLLHKKGFCLLWHAVFKLVYLFRVSLNELGEKCLSLVNKGRSRDIFFSWNFDLLCINFTRYCTKSKKCCVQIHTPNEDIKTKLYTSLPVSDADVQECYFFNNNFLW